MKTEKAGMEKLAALRSRLDAEIKALMDRRAGVDMALALLSGEDDAGVDMVMMLSGPGGSSPRRRDVKKTVMDIICKAAEIGVTTAEVVEVAHAMGRDLPRASVSSMLSKFKASGTLRFDGGRYYAVLAPAPAAGDSEVARPIGKL